MHPWGWGFYENTQEIIFWYTIQFDIFCYISKTTKNLKLKFLDLQIEKYGLSFDIKKCSTPGWALGDEKCDRHKVL